MNDNIIDLCKEIKNNNICPVCGGDYENSTCKYCYTKSDIEEQLQSKLIDLLNNKKTFTEDELINLYKINSINIDKVKINGYICETNINNIKMNSENETISLIYNKDI